MKTYFISIELLFYLFIYLFIWTSLSLGDKYFFFKNKDKRKNKFLWNEKTSIVGCHFGYAFFKMKFCSKILPKIKFFQKESKQGSTDEK